MSIDSRNAKRTCFFPRWIGKKKTGRIMALPCSRRQPLHELGRYCAGTVVPVQSVGEPHRQALTVPPPPDGTFPVVSSGARVRSVVSILPSWNPRNDALITPKSLVVTLLTYRDTSLASQPQLPGPGGSPPELYSSATAFLQGLNARITSDILARTALALTLGKISAASTPMTMTTIMSSTIVNPACRLSVLRKTHSFLLDRRGASWPRMSGWPQALCQNGLRRINL